MQDIATIREKNKAAVKEFRDSQQKSGHGPGSQTRYMLAIQFSDLSAKDLWLRSKRLSLITTRLTAPEFEQAVTR